MSETWQIRALGKLEIRQEGEPVAKVAAAKAQALPVYLALTGRPHSRGALAGCFGGNQRKKRPAPACG